MILTFNSFNQYIVRTPSFSVTKYLDLLANYNLEKALLFLDNPFFNEALFLASPDLCLLLKKLETKDNSLSLEKRKALELTLLKYIARICARCTPFGLFAGCAVGTFAPQTDIELMPYSEFEKFTQFDMHFWIRFLQKIESKNADLTTVLKYFPNSSMYTSGDFYRYVEYKYNNKKRVHSVSEIRKSTILSKIVTHSKKGLLISQIISLIIEDESEKEEAFFFVEELIKNQFLVSELEAVVTGDDEWSRVLKIVQKSSSTKNLHEFICDLQNDFKTLNKTFGNIQIYNSLKEKIEKVGFEYESKFLFQTDLNITTVVNTLDKNVPKKISEALLFLNGIQKEDTLSNLADFITAFTKRYETREMPLALVLDAEIGIGYLQNDKSNDSHTLLEKFSFGIKKPLNTIENWSETDKILEKKRQDCIDNKQTEIVLSPKDFPDFNPNSNKIPPTFSTIIEMTTINNKAVVVLQHSGNTSALKLLGRFCNGNSQIHDASKIIAEKEKEYYKDKILSEIVHIPESRTGNILRRPILREYEIPYLSNSVVPKSNQIDINDLTISVVANKIILKSKKQKKEVIPFLSNAHNFSNNSLPVYHFLCDLGRQNLKPINNFQWGVLENHYSYFPRVKYKEIIISKAKWIVFENEIKEILGDKTKFNDWKCNRKITRFVNWTNGDNTLLIDLESDISVEMWLNSVKNYAKIILEEFLFTEDSIIKTECGEKHANQFIISFYKK